MPTMIYPAVVSGDQAAGYRAHVVDLPEVEVLRPHPADLLGAARQSLHEALLRREAEGQDWPSPTPFESVAGQMAPGSALLMVDVQVEDTPIRVNISIGDRLLRRLDEAAEAQHMTRSGFIAAAVRQKLGDERVSGAGSQRMQEELSDIRRRLNEALGPESTFGRTVAELDARALDGLRAVADNLAAAVRRRQGPPSDPPPR